METSANPNWKKEAKIEEERLKQIFNTYTYEQLVYGLKQSRLSGKGSPQELMDRLIRFDLRRLYGTQAAAWNPEKDNDSSRRMSRSSLAPDDIARSQATPKDNPEADRPGPSHNSSLLDLEIEATLPSCTINPRTSPPPSIILHDGKPSGKSASTPFPGSRSTQSLTFASNQEPSNSEGRFIDSRSSAAPLGSEGRRDLEISHQLLLEGPTSSEGRPDGQKAARQSENHTTNSHGQANRPPLVSENASRHSPFSSSNPEDIAASLSVGQTEDSHRNTESQHESGRADPRTNYENNRVLNSACETNNPPPPYPPLAQWPYPPYFPPVLPFRTSDNLSHPSHPYRFDLSSFYPNFPPLPPHYSTECPIVNPLSLHRNPPTENHAQISSAPFETIPSPISQAIGNSRDARASNLANSSLPPPRHTDYSFEKETRLCNLLQTWKIHFTGRANMETEEFITRMLEFRNSHQIDDREILRLMPIILSGPAWDWALPIYREWHSIEDFVKALRSRYVEPNYQKKLLETVKQRTQGPEEPIAEYISGLRVTMEKLVPKWNLLQQLDRAVDNLHPRYWREVKRSQINSFEDLLLLGQQQEILWEKERAYRPPPPPERSMVPRGACQTRSKPKLAALDSQLHEEDNFTTKEAVVLSKSQSASLQMWQPPRRQFSPSKKERTIAPRTSREGTADRGSFAPKNNLRPSEKGKPVSKATTATQTRDSREPANASPPTSSRIAKLTIGNSAPGRNLSCWICKEDGHQAANCSKKAGRLCYKCRYPDVTVRTCPRCNPKQGNDQGGRR